MAERPFLGWSAAGSICFNAAIGSFSTSRSQSLGRGGGGDWNFDATHSASLIAGPGSPGAAGLADGA